MSSTPATLAKTFPGRRLLAIDVSSADVTPVTQCRAFYVGTAGNIAVIAADDTNPVTLKVPAGVLLPIEVKTFKNSGTTATDIIAIF